MVVRMKRAGKLTQKPNEYEVGYKKPPKANQFKPGKSGNPTGRPKGSKNFKTELEEELHEKITIKESGKPKKVPKQRAMLKALMAKAIQGDVKAATAIFSMLSKLATPEELDGASSELTKTDQEILDEFITRITADQISNGQE